MEIQKSRTQNQLLNMDIQNSKKNSGYGYPKHITHFWICPFERLKWKIKITFRISISGGHDIDFQIIAFVTIHADLPISGCQLKKKTKNEHGGWFLTLE